MANNSIHLVKLIADNERVSVEEVSKKLHVSYIAGWEFFAQSVAYYVAKILLGKNPTWLEIRATANLSSCDKTARLLEEGIVSGNIPRF